MIRSYRDLDVWKDAMDLVEAVHAASTGFPSDERFGLTAQMRRAAVSVPSKIAEGHARASTREYLGFPAVSPGTRAELETRLHIAHRLRLIEDQPVQRLPAMSERIGRMLRALGKSLSARLDPQPPAPGP